MMPLRKGIIVAATVALVGGVACEDGFFAPRAPAAHTSLLSISATTLGGSASAFDRCDALDVLLTSTPIVFSVAQAASAPAPRLDALQATFFDTTLAFTPAAETRITLPVEITTSPDTLLLYATLKSSGAVVFNGSATVVLKRGETTSLTLTLLPHPGAIVSPGIPTFTAIGDTIYGHAAVLFPTGDTIRSARATWTSTNPLIVATPRDSTLVAVAEGQATVQVSYGSLYGPVVQPVTVLVRAVEASIAVSPRNPVVQLSALPQLFSAVTRDRRGNTLVRIPNWSSSNLAVATISATTGVATLVGAGTTYIKATVGTVKDSTLLTVQPVGPAAPTSLTVTGGSSAQTNLSWNDNSINEDRFEVERCLGIGCTPAPPAVFSASGTTFTTGLRNFFDASAQMTPSTLYGYRVRACNSNGCSTYTSTAYGSTLARETTPPAVPTSPTATMISNQVNFSWSHGGTNVVGFVVERAGYPQMIWQQIAVIYGTNVQSLSDTNVVVGTYYQYRVSAFNAAGSSGPSNIATVNMPS